MDGVSKKIELQMRDPSAYGRMGTIGAMPPRRPPGAPSGTPSPTMVKAVLMAVFAAVAALVMWLTVRRCRLTHQLEPPS